MLVGTNSPGPICQSGRKVAVAVQMEAPVCVGRFLYLEISRVLLDPGEILAKLARYFPKGEYIADVEKVCLKLSPRQQQNLGQKPVIYLKGTMSPFAHILVPSMV